MRHEHGVTSYTKGTVKVPVYFPDGETVCANCRFIISVHGLRYQCICTDEIVLYPTECVGNKCPIEWDNIEEVTE